MEYTVKIREKVYPIKCNIGIMEIIQDKYDTFLNFEMKVLGYAPALDETGSLLMRDGSPVVKPTEPSLKTIYDILPLMLEAAGNEDVELSQEVLEFDLDDVGLAMREAYKDCYKRKNPQSARDQEDKTTTKK